MRLWFKTRPEAPRKKQVSPFFARRRSQYGRGARSAFVDGFKVNAKRFGALTFISVLLATLAAGAPLINAGAGPPRSVFLRLPEGTPEPEIALEAYRLATGRWLLEIDASQFRFTALCLSEAAPVPVGHAHVIRGGVKVASAYHPIVDLGELPPGTHRIRVVLRGQDHRALIAQGGLIAAEIDITVPQA